VTTFKVKKRYSLKAPCGFSVWSIWATIKEAKHTSFEFLIGFLYTKISPCPPAAFRVQQWRHVQTTYWPTSLSHCCFVRQAVALSHHTQWKIQRGAKRILTTRRQTRQSRLLLILNKVPAFKLCSLRNSNNKNRGSLMCRDHGRDRLLYRSSLSTS